MNFTLIRIVDANANRAREALRVIEDCLRFIKNHGPLTDRLKRYRHEVTRIVLSSGIGARDLLESRESRRDVGKHSVRHHKEGKGIFTAMLVRNFKRAEESLRVLEECSKCLNKKSAFRFQNLRFKIYELEKTVLRKF